LDHPFLKNDTHQENSQVLCRITGFSCLPVTLDVMRIIQRPSDSCNGYVRRVTHVWISDIMTRLSIPLRHQADKQRR
jgi:hypothetical protein